MEIKVENLSKSFKKNTVLKDVNLSMTSGKIYGLSGRNGSGKSVLLKLICGLYKPTSGKVLFDGIEYNSNDVYVPNLRALIEKPSFFPNLSGFENLKLLANIQHKISDNEINNALKVVNLYEEKDKKYSEYSLGMKQKLGISQVIMENPQIMILDEPFNGIEVDTVKKISKYLLQEKKKNKLIIVSTHIKEDLDNLSDEIYSFDNGTVKKVWKNFSDF